MSSLIVLTLDSLATSAMVPYGCSWLETPGLNRLAASSLVFDRIVADSVSPNDVLSGFLRDMHSGTSVAAAAAAAGMTTLLFTDSHEATGLAAANGFDQCVRIDPPARGSGAGEAAAVADSVEEMQFARLLAAALDHRESLGDAPALLWIHSSSLRYLWDAPHALRNADEHEEREAEFESDDYGGYGESEYGETEQAEFEDVGWASEIDAARQSVVPPDCRLAEGADPDLLLAWMASYGGQIRAIDALLDVLLDTLEESLETEFVLASTSGFALGEHQWIGPAAGPPHSPRIHLPLMVRRRGQQPLRSLHLASSDRLAATLIEMISGPTVAGSEHSLLRDITPERWAAPPEPLAPIVDTAAADLAATADWGATADLGATADPPPSPSPTAALRGTVLRTAPGWFYRRDAAGGEHLYLKPDDRNDINDIANLEPEVVRAFQDTAD